MSKNISDSSERRRIIEDSGQFLIANIVSQAIKMVRPFVLLPLFTPSQLGIWNLMGVIIGYGANAHLGLLHGMNKAIPVMRGQGKTEKVEEIKDTSFWFIVILSAVSGFAFFLISWIAFPKYKFPGSITSIALVLQLVYLYFFCLLRAENRFNMVSKGFVILSVGSIVAVISLALLVNNSLYGALMGLSVGYLIVILYFFMGSGYSFRFRLSYDSISMAFRMGLPLIILGFLFMVFMSIDRWVIAWKLDEAALGFYALGIMASGLLSMIPSALENVLYPRMLERCASSHKPDLRSAVNLFMMPLQFISSLMVIIIGGVSLILPLIIRLFLPKYSLGLGAMAILIPAAFLLSIASFGGIYIISIDKQKVLMLVTILGSLVSFSLDLVFLSAGYGINGVAVGTAMGYAVYGLGYVLFASYYALNGFLSSIMFVGRILFPYGVMLFSLAIAKHFIPDGLNYREDLMYTFYRFSFVLSLSIFAIWINYRKGKMLSIMSFEIRAWIFAKFRRDRKNHRKGSEC